MRTKAFLATALVASLGVAACGEDDKDKSASSGGGASQEQTTKPTEEQAAGGKTAEGAKVAFVSPKTGESVSGGTAKVTVNLTDFALDAKAVGKMPAANRGHLHFSMDGGKFDFPKYSGANGQLAQKLGVQGKYSPSVTPTITYRNLPKGKHRLEVYLANNDHSDTGVEAETTFTVK